MSPQPYDTLQIRELRQEEVKYAAVLSEAFHWPINETVLQQGRTTGVLLGAFPREGDAHLFEKEGNISAPHLLACAAFFIQGPRWSLAYVLTDPAHHRNGISSLLLNRITQLARDSTYTTTPPLSLWLSATPSGQPLYQRLGYVTQSRTLILMTSPSIKLSEAVSQRAKVKQDDSDEIIVFNPGDDRETWTKGIAYAGASTFRDLHQTSKGFFLDGTIQPLMMQAVLCISKQTSQVIGFGALRPYGTTKWHIGPLVATTQDLAKAIVCRLVEFTATVPGAAAEDKTAISASSLGQTDPNWINWLSSLGFEVLMPAPIMSFDLTGGQRKEATALSDVEWGYIDPGAC